MSEKWSAAQIENISMGAAATRAEMTSIIRQLIAELALAKKATAREILEILTIVDENNADYEDTWQQSFTAIRAKYGVE